MLLTRLLFIYGVVLAFVALFYGVNAMIPAFAY